jgi:deoxyadenosine/deoxycytidine kinase|uniref:Deoxynucleoside kinase domain-containing protein n=1 Tax=viral metagenome TaxID=1070528 RepID=A0A6C0IX80_9ZZZZ
MPIIVQVVSGSIGAGKSSILHTLRGLTAYDRNVYILDENVAAWQYYLERMYMNPCNETVFLFQMEVAFHMHTVTKFLDQLTDAHKNDDEKVIVYVERSPLDVLEVFLPLNRDRLSDENYRCLVTMMQVYANHAVWQNANYYYISCPFRICAERVRKRSRDGEQKIDDDYLQRVEHLYDEMARKVNARVLNNYGRNALLQTITALTEKLL